MIAIALRRLDSARVRLETSWPSARWWLVALPLAALALVVALDAVLSARWWPIPVVGLLDEPAHLATAALLIAAFAPRRTAALWPWALAASVLIDLDHVALYVGWKGVAADGGRPFTHSLVVLAVLVAAAVLLRRWRLPLLGAAVGVGLHLVRDLASRPGVPLFWPWQASGYQGSEVTYLVLLAVATVVATARVAREVSAR